MESTSSYIKVLKGKSSKANKNSNIIQKAGQLATDVEASMHCDSNESDESSISHSSLLEEPNDFDSDSSSDVYVQAADEWSVTVKDVNQYLKGKVGADINAKKWLEGCEGLDDLDKSEIIIKLVYEVCFAENIEYNLENDAAENEKENIKDKGFCTRRIFKILKTINCLLLPQDRKKLLEFVCQNNNLKSLEMICKLEAKDSMCKMRIENEYPWKGEFSGYETLIELLQYALKQQCSSEIVLCIAKKVFGRAHFLCNGQQYLDGIKVARKKKFGYQIEDCLKTAIELGYKDVVSVMLSGDIYHSIRLMKNEKFQEEDTFREALDMIEEAVADVLSSWVKEQSCKSEVLSLLKQGIELHVEKLKLKDLRNELNYREVKLSRYEARSKKRLVEKFREEGMKVRLNRAVVGALISTLFFEYQNELMKDKKPFKLKISLSDKKQREKEINEFNKNIHSKQFLQQTVLKSVQALNSSSHVSNSWFFREVLEKVVNDNLDKLKAVCAAICKETMEELIKDMEVAEDVVDVLGFFNVEPNQIKTLASKKIHPGVGIVSHFTGNIKNLVKGIRELNDSYLMVQEVLEIAKGISSGKVPAFSGLSRRRIINLKRKRNKTNDETKDLKEKVSQIMDEIKRGVNILAKSGNDEYSLDTEDIFRHFKIINSEIGKEDKTEIVKVICQNGNVKLLEMICRQEMKGIRSRIQIHEQYPWKGEFTGFLTLIDLLQYVLKQPCSAEIVLCIAKKVYGTHHNICNGKNYLEDSLIQSMEKKLDQPSSVMEECLKKAIELSYKEVVLVMLSGDIYHCIRLMKEQRFQEEEGFREALDMIEEAVADVMSSWVKEQSCKSEVLSLLKRETEIQLEKMTKNKVKNELNYREVKFSRYEARSKTRLVETLKEGGREIRLSGAVVGALISTLFFNHQNEFLKDKRPFKLEIAFWENNKRYSAISEFNRYIGSKKILQQKVLKSVQILNSSSHVCNTWFFRELLEKVVNGNLDKLKAVCTAICKEKVEELIEDVEVDEDVVDVLNFFGIIRVSAHKTLKDNLTKNMNKEIEISDLLRLTYILFVLFSFLFSLI